MQPDETTIAQAVARVASPQWEAFSAQLESSGGCFQPVRLRGSVTEVDRARGAVRLGFTTATQPDGVLLKACGSRRATRCQPCSVIYKGDARALVGAGLAGGKGVPETVGEHPTVFVTLTAPSFGAVHSAAGGRSAACRPAGEGRCAHGRPLACRSRHLVDEEMVGSAICPDCYDHRGAVVWNARVSELWRRTVIGIGRSLAGQLSIPVRQLRRHLRVSFAKVVEFQRRGVVHLHAVVRLDGADGESPDVGVDLLANAVRLAAARTRAPNPIERGSPVSWGPQLEVRAVRTEGRRGVANYLAKYATKSTDDDGLLDRRLTEAAIDHLELPDHLRRLVGTAWELGGTEALAHLRLRPWAHCLGFRGHWLTKSRRYSTTFVALRAARQAWRVARSSKNPSRVRDARAEESLIEIGSWSYAGRGHNNDGENWLAVSLAIRRSEWRTLSWEERDVVPAHQDSLLASAGGAMRVAEA